MIRATALARGLAVPLGLALMACSAAPGGTPAAVGDGGDDAPSPRATAATQASPPATPPASGAPNSTAPAAAADPLLDVALVDVRSGEAFTLGELAADAPVLVETMAIWCSNCRAQQRQVVGAHDLAQFHSVSIDVDPNERADDLADYSDREGFDWRFVLADAELATMLRDRFSPAVLNPPSMPKLLITADGTVALVGLNEQLSADAIAALVGA